MADTKISALPGATTPLAGTEVVPLVQSSTTKNVSVANLTAGRDVSALSLATTGNVGINTSVSPYYALNVDGSTAYQIAYFRNNNSTGYGPQIRAASDASSNSFAVQDYAGTNNYFVVRGDGNAFFDIGNVYSTGNFVVSTSGKGIDFSANTGAAGMTSEQLTWYEEGTWTPSIGGSGTAGTYELAIASGWYTRIGRQVTVIFNIKLDTSITGGGSGFLVINNLPFTIATTNAVTGSCMLGNVNFTSTAKYVVPATRSVGSTQLILEEVYANAAINDVSITIIAANNTIQGTITYLA